MYPRRFQPVTPRNLSTVIEGATRPYRVLLYDDDSMRELKKYPGHGLYLDSTGHKMLLYLEFKINGYTFRRRCVNEQIGNWGVMWVQVGGTTYQLYPRSSHV